MGFTTTQEGGRVKSYFSNLPLHIVVKAHTGYNVLISALWFLDIQKLLSTDVCLFIKLDHPTFWQCQM